MTGIRLRKPIGTRSDWPLTHSRTDIHFSKNDPKMKCDANDMLTIL